MRALVRGVLAFIALYVVLVVLGRVGQLRHGPGYLVVVAFVLLVGVAVAWASTRGQRGARSGRDLRDIGIASSAGKEHMGPGQGHD